MFIKSSGVWVQVISFNLGSMGFLTNHSYKNYEEDLLGVIHDLPPDAQRALLVGHNPGLWELTVALSEQDSVPSLTPATLVVLDLDVAQWADVGSQCGRMRDIIRPEHH